MQGSRHVEIVNTTKGTTLGTRVRVADTSWSRMFGLLGETSLDPGGGLLIQPSSGVHTFGMKFAIDIVALDRQCRVLGAWTSVGPFRVAGLDWKTRRVLELPGGAIRDSLTAVGDQIAIRNQDPPADRG
jgi:uncharacterized membrane protein (UPF0127 family)